MSTDRMKFILQEIGSDYYTMDELKEAFEKQGEEKHVQRPSELLELIDHYLPDQSGYGVFCMQNIICVGLLWCSGLDYQKFIEATADSEGQEQSEDASEKKYPMVGPASGVVSEVEDEDEEAS